MYSVTVPGAVPVRRRQEAVAVLNAKSSLSREDDTLSTKFYNLAVVADLLMVARDAELHHE